MRERHRLGESAHFVGESRVLVSGHGRQLFNFLLDGALNGNCDAHHSDIVTVTAELVRPDTC